MNSEIEVDAAVEPTDAAVETTDSIQLSLNDLDMVAGGNMVNVFG